MGGQRAVVSPSGLSLGRVLVLFQRLVEDFGLWHEIDFLKGEGLISKSPHFFFHFQVKLIFRNLRILCDIDILLVFTTGAIGIGHVLVILIEIKGLFGGLLRF